MDEENKEATHELNTPHEDHALKKTEDKLIKKLRSNPWIVSTFVLGLFVLIILVTGFGGMTGNVVSEIDAGASVLGFVQSQTDGQGSLVSVEDFESNMYQVTINYQDQEIPLFLTKDGKYLVQGLTPLEIEETPSSPSTNDQPPATEIIKSDKPEVELFVWSYCPYGVQAQGPLAEVAILLKDDANFKAVLYYDGHGAYETQQNKIQACIQEVDGKNYWDYAAGFVTDIYPKCGSFKDIDCDKEESIKLMKSVGINSDKVMSCVESQGVDLIAADSARAQSLGVTGSPTIVINGVKANPSGRTAEAYKGSVCSAFNTAPELCGTALSSEAAASAGNC
jgi:hypothetical protein